VARTEKVHVSDLSGARREALFEQLFAIYSERKSGWTLEAFVEANLSHPDTVIALFRDSDDALAGFSWVSTVRFEHEGQRHAVFTAGVYFRRGYEARAAALFGLGEALRFKLREPRTRLAYFTPLISPAPYAFILGVMGRAYPNRRMPTPPAIDALVRAAARVRGFALAPGGSWVVHTRGTPRDGRNFDVSRSLQNNLDALYYRQLNPRFAAHHSLLVWIPLDLANVVGALTTLTMRAIGA
jgi:hypothetical protein